MTRLERLRHELVALAESLCASSACHSCSGLGVIEVGRCAPCDGTGGKATHPIATSLRAIAWSLLPREERYREPEHAGGPLVELSCGACNATGLRCKRMSEGADLSFQCDRCNGRGGWGSEVDRAADELIRLVAAFPQCDGPTRVEIVRVASALRGAVVQARPGETIDDALRREGLELAEETCLDCDGYGGIEYSQTCSECRNGRVVAEDAIEVRVAGQVRYARRRETCE